MELSGQKFIQHNCFYNYTNIPYYSHELTQRWYLYGIVHTLLAVPMDWSVQIQPDIGCEYNGS